MVSENKEKEEIMPIQIDQINRSLKAIESFSLKPLHYLQVVGQGEQQHLEVVQKNWLGRILMWLGLTCACMKNVAKFIETHANELFSHAKECNPSSLKVLKEKISRSRHLKKSTVDRINAIAEHHAPIAPVPTQVKTPDSPVKQPVSSADLAAARVKSLTDLQNTIRNYKKKTLNKGQDQGVPLSPSVPVVPFGQPPEISTTLLLQEYRKAVSEGLQAVDDFFGKYIDVLQASVVPQNGPRFAHRMGVIINEMTPGDIARFVEDTTQVDIFRIRDEIVYCPHPRLMGALGLMSEDQILAFIETIAKSTKWDLVYLRDAFLKISFALPKSQDNKYIEFLVSQPRFFMTNILQVSPIPSATDALEKAIEEAEFIADAKLSAHYVHYIINNPIYPDTLKLQEFIELKCLANNEGSLIKSHPFLKQKEYLKNGSQPFLATLSKKDQRQLGMVLVQKCPTKIWEDSLLIKNLLDDISFAGQLIGCVNDDNIRNTLISRCKNIKILEQLSQDAETFTPSLSRKCIADQIYHLKVENAQAAEANRNELRMKARLSANMGHLNIPVHSPIKSPNTPAKILLANSPRRNH